jgi:hypothetical protein
MIESEGSAASNDHTTCVKIIKHQVRVRIRAFRATTLGDRVRVTSKDRVNFNHLRG